MIVVYFFLYLFQGWTISDQGLSKLTLWYGIGQLPAALIGLTIESLELSSREG